MSKAFEEMFVKPLEELTQRERRKREREKEQEERYRYEPEKCPRCDSELFEPYKNGFKCLKCGKKLETPEEDIENTGEKRTILRAGQRTVWIDENETKWCKVWGVWYKLKALE